MRPPLPASPRPSAALLLPLTLALLAACGGGRGEATLDDIDTDAPPTVTEKELAAFTEPRDSVLSEAQVEQYLKASLLQFDLVREHGTELHGRVAKMDERAKKGGVIAGLRNLADAGATVTQFADVVGGSYVRASRALGYNPAEMEWVRDRFGEVATHLMVKPMYEMALQSAQQMRAQAEQARRQLEEARASGQPAYYTEDDIEQMLANAAETEAEVRANLQTSRAVEANLAVLRRARPAVSEPMWSTIGFAAGGTGLIALSGLNDPSDAQAQQKLDEYRALFQDALDNRVTPGMEAPTPAEGGAAEGS